MQEFDVAIVGAGAAGLFCASVAGQLGLRVVLIDHSARVAEKIRISGGGRSNFTNTQVSAANYLGQNPRFAKSALARYTPRDFVELVRKHGIGFHEKHKGQLFCDQSAQQLIDMLLAECTAGGVAHWQPCALDSVRFSASSPCGKGASSYEIDSERGTLRCAALVVATGGLSIPKIGASDWGYRIARQFDLPVVPTRPALVPLTFDAAAWAPFAELSGLSLPVEIATGGKKDTMRFQEDLLFTHRGLSGPAVLQISSYWQPGTPIRLNLSPSNVVAEQLLQAKAEGNRRKTDSSTWPAALWASSRAGWPCTRCWRPGLMAMYSAAVWWGRSRSILSSGPIFTVTLDPGAHPLDTRRHHHALQIQVTDRKFNRMRPSMARVFGLETRSAKEG